jgi:ATP-binding cassette subfamily C protein
VGKQLIRDFLTRFRQHVWIVVFASVLVNLLVFAGSVYMMLVYDSVLPSRSEPTLFGLFAMLIVLYLMQGALEAIRSEALLAVANGVHRDLVQPVHHAATVKVQQSQRESQGMQLVRDLDQVHGFLTSAGPVALIDLPWVVLFLIVLTMFHWALGLTALLGSLLLVGIAWLTAQRTTAGTRNLAALTAQRFLANQTEMRFAEPAMAMGMQQRLLQHAKEWDDKYLTSQSFLSRTVSRLGGAGRLFRLFLQSTMLTVGALLVIDGKASGGIILAASILAGRALAPVDQALASARALSMAREAWGRIAEALGAHPLSPDKAMALPPPCREIVVRDLWVVPPGAQSAVLSGVSFRAEAGQALALIGPSAAGKSTLAKALLGVWPAARGEIRLDGATHGQWDRDVLGQSFGYVPQSIELLEGTVGQNISRFDPAATSEAIVTAAQAAGMHETILALPQGYETLLRQGGGELSAGQRQRVALARALYGDPFIIVLDEPNSNLDAAGDEALAQAITGVRARGGIVIMVTHRPATLGPMSHIAIIRAGKLADFGERDAVLRRQAQAQGQGTAQGQPQGQPQDPGSAPAKRAAKVAIGG